MIDFADIEFYSTPEGEVMVKPKNGPVKILQDTDRELIQAMLQVINDRYPGAFAVLSDLYSSSSMNRSYYEFMMVHRFCRCNFGAFDTLQLDIDLRGNLHLEQVPCPLRNTGDCKFCGSICSPVLNTKLSAHEMKILEYIASGLTNQQIADQLNISIFTVIRHRNNIRSKLGVNNTAELIAKYKSMLHI